MLLYIKVLVILDYAGWYKYYVNLATHIKPITLDRDKLSKQRVVGVRAYLIT